MTGTVQFHRVLLSTPAKIWRAYTQPDAFARWLPPNGFVGRIDQLDAKVGGAWRGSFPLFSTLQLHHRQRAGLWRQISGAG